MNKTHLFDITKNFANQNEAMEISGASLKDAAIIANHAAGLAVEKMENASVSKAELNRTLIHFFS